MVELGKITILEKSMAYVYRHIRLDKNEPFYIGIGSRKNHIRAKTVTKRNPFWHNITSKTEWEYEILLDDISWDEALKKEIEFISLYGRSDLNKGTLVNLTDGGEGTLGSRHSEVVRQRLSKFNSGKKLSPEHVNKIVKANIGRVCSPESKKRMSESAKGRKASAETRAKMSKIRMGNKSNTGRKLPESQKAKMKLSQIARREREANHKIINGKVR